MSAPMPFAVNCPINSLSFGQVSVAILREMHKRGLTPSVFPIGGQVDLSTQHPDKDFQTWLTGCINSGQGRHSRAHPSIRLWHISGSLEGVSNQGNRLVTFQETGQLTTLETHILNQQKAVYVTNRYAESFFRMCGVAATYLPLGFDSANFRSLEKRGSIDGVTSFLLAGKAETKRKWTYRQLSLWAKRYGNRREYRLNCAIDNSFLSPDHQKSLIGQALEGRQYWNIVFHPFCKTNAEYNALLQSSEIVLACSGSEGFGLPEYHAAALGAWPVALKAHAYLDYFTDQNAIWVKPNGMEPIYDGIFFHAGAPLNQGNVFTFEDDSFYAGCEEAERRCKTIGINSIGLELQKQTYSTAADILLRDLAM